MSLFHNNKTEKKIKSKVTKIEKDVISKPSKKVVSEGFMFNKKKDICEDNPTKKSNKVISEVVSEGFMFGKKEKKNITNTTNKVKSGGFLFSHDDSDIENEQTDDDCKEDVFVKYSYPEQNKFNYKKNIEDKLGPYSTQWIHDEQEDDKINDIILKRTYILNKLMDIEYPEQRSKAWFDLRRNRATASDGGTILDMNKHEAQYKFLIKKVKEPPFSSNVFCHHGTKHEQVATMVYEYRMNVKVEDFGLVAHPNYYFLAASPDGIVGKYKLDGKSLTKEVGKMLEIKCPLKRKILDEGEIKGEICPIYYWIQVQLQLECCDLDECDFWQCDIWEYEDKEEFLRDTDLDEPFRSKSMGMEKGCIIQLMPKSKYEDIKSGKYLDVLYGESKYLYPSKIEMSPYDCDIWIANCMANFNKVCAEQKINSVDYYFDKIVYWKIAKTKCSLINRDKKWFLDNLPELERMWKYVEYFRNNSDKADTFFNYIESLPIKNNKKIMNIAKQICTEPNKDDRNAIKEYTKLIVQLTEDTIKNNTKYQEDTDDD